MISAIDGPQSQLAEPKLRPKLGVKSERRSEAGSKFGSKLKIINSNLFSCQLNRIDRAHDDL